MSIFGFGFQIMQMSLEEEIAKCNPAQRAAIQTIEGPVLVLAGPGTGKTQILALRICNILQQTDVNPENILCLTYTDAGRNAMQKRLSKFLGKHAVNVTVHTFHSFCNEVIQQNPVYFPNLGSERTMDDLERIELMQEVITNFDDESLLKKFKGDIYSDANALLKLYDEINKENHDVDSLVAFIESSKAKLPFLERFIANSNRFKGYKQGDVLQNKVDEYTEELQMFIEAVKSYKHYNQLKSKKGFYDFGDMIQWVLRAWENNPNLLLDYQERYQYILVDEFQDNNGSQYDLITQLVSYWGENPNLFVVGDDDQSVYSFQGAEHKRLKDFVLRYNDFITCIVLTENYRSSQEILHTAQKVIVNNGSSRLPFDEEIVGLFKDKGQLLSKELNAGGKNAKLVDTVYFKPCINEYYEAAYIVGELLNRKANGDNLSDSAIIFAKHANADPIVKLLSFHKIPFTRSKTENLLLEPFIRNLLALLKLISGETTSPSFHDDLFFRVLNADFLGFPTHELAKFQFSVSAINRNRNENDWLPLRDALRNSEFIVGLEISCGKHLVAFHTILEKAQKNIFNTTLQVFLEEVINGFGIKDFILGKQNRAF